MFGKKTTKKNNMQPRKQDMAMVGTLENIRSFKILEVYIMNKKITAMEGASEGPPRVSKQHWSSNANNNRE